MATKSRKTASSGPKSSSGKKERGALPPGSEHNVWLAGLGALAQAQANAQAEGNKAFEALVNQGLEMQARTQAAAKQQWQETTEKMNALSAQMTANPWDRLSDIFQGRVARALTHMGMPSAEQLADLEKRVAALEHALKIPQPVAKAATTPKRAPGTSGKKR